MGLIGNGKLDRNLKWDLVFLVWLRQILFVLMIYLSGKGGF